MEAANKQSHLTFGDHQIIQKAIENEPSKKAISSRNQANNYCTLIRFFIHPWCQNKKHRKVIPNARDILLQSKSRLISDGFRVMLEYFEFSI